MKTLYFFGLLLISFNLSAQINYTVNTTDDWDDGNCNSIHCSLREAINSSNNDGVESRIQFKIFPVGENIIQPNTALPPITEAGTQIRGYTQWGYVDEPLIIIDGSLISNSTVGLVIWGNDTKVYSIQIRNFSGNAIAIGSAADNVTIGSWGLGNKIYNNGFHGVSIFPNSNNISIVENQIYDNVESGIYAQYMSDISIQGNEIYNNKHGIFRWFVSQANILQNSIYCNTVRAIAGNKLNTLDQQTTAPPIINQILWSSNSGIYGIRGVSEPNASIQLYKSNADCANTNCGGKTFLGYVTADVNGNWYTAASSFNLDTMDIITGLATLNNSTSQFSGCTPMSNTECSTSNVTAFTVNSTDDTNDSYPGDGICEDINGNCTFRAAIQEANTTSSLNTITFESTISEIEFSSNLPDIMYPLTVDGGTTGNVIFNGKNTSDGISSRTSCLKYYGIHFKKFPDEAIKFSGFGIENIEIGASNKGCVFTENGIAIFFREETSNVFLKGNYIGTDTQLSQSLGNREGIDFSGSATTNIQNFQIGGNLPSEQNVIAYNERGLDGGIDGEFIIRPYNSIYCNDFLFFNNSTNNYIESINEDSIIGYAESNALIAIYFNSLEDCPYSICQGGTLMDTTYSNASGRWTIPTPESLVLNDRVSFTSTPNLGTTSPFQCFSILPDDCKFAESLPVNASPCSSVGIISDLKQLTNSTSIPTASCANTYAGNDAWYKVKVPESGNFLVRTNTSNTVVPVIEIYLNCSNNALPECSILDTLPYIMLFENYTPDETLYLRVWDKDNEVVSSTGTALLHLTAHELDVDKSKWEICDYENLITDNPTNLIRREANNFILSYDNNTPQNVIDEDSTVFTDMMEMELIKSCNCGGAPLQLWSTENPIVLDDRRKYAKSRGSVDTTNYNYIFETVEFQVNSYASGKQHATDIAMDGEGNFVMVWKDNQRRHNYGRVYKSSGNPESVEFQVGASEKTQHATSIEILENGDFIAVWHEIDISQPGANFAVYGRLFNADGTPKSSAFSVSEAAAEESTDAEIRELVKYGTNAQLAVDGNGNFVVVWHVGNRIFAQGYDNTANLRGGVFEVGETVNSNIVPNPAIAVNTSGVFIISWNGSDNDETGVFAQRFHANGTAMESAFLVNTTQNERQNNPAITLWDNGAFTIIWESFNQQNDFDIYGQRFNMSGDRVGSEFLINSYVSDAQKSPSISKFNDGSFLTAWSSFGQDGYAEGIYAKLFDANGSPISPNFDDSMRGSVGAEFRMNTFNEPQQDKPKTATNKENIFMAAWEDGKNDGSQEGIFAQRYEKLVVDNTTIFYAIGTATPSTLLGDPLMYPSTVYQPEISAKQAKVAIIDTGIDDNHALIKNAIWNNPEENDSDNCLLEDEIGYDFVNRNGTPIDVDGHGTQVNGMVTRDFDSSVKLELMNLKFHELKKGSVFDAICGIYYAVDNGANVINLSWGFEASEEPIILKRALQYASDNDVLIITTAGNTSKNNDRINKYPANLDIPNMIVVTAYQYKTSSGEIKLANYASYGEENVDIAAYGYVETSKKLEQKTLAAGTSLAAPAVARTAATIKGLYPILTAAEIKDCILSTVVAVPTLTYKVATGGVLDHTEALVCAEQKANLIVANGCNISGLSLSTEVIPESCLGNDGVINLSFLGSDSNPNFTWSTGMSTQNINNLAAGTYSVVVTDSERCMQSMEIEVEKDCEIGDCQTNLNLTAFSSGNQSIHSDNTIVTNAIVATDATVVLNAAHSITLTTDFAAQQGSSFLAKIEDCTTNLVSNDTSFYQPFSIVNGQKVENLSIKLFPNPAKDILNIQIDKTKTGFKLELYNAVGNRLEINDYSENLVALPIHQLDAGLYFLRIDSEIMAKFVVVKQ